MEIVIKKKANDGLFRIPVYKIPEELANSLPNMEGLKPTLKDIKIWHDSLGHPGKTMMCKLIEEGRIPKFCYSDVRELISRCSACNLAKARAIPVPKRSRNQVSKTMERIHCDAVTGLPPTVSGKTGFSLIVDEYTKYIDI